MHNPPPESFPALFSNRLSSLQFWFVFPSGIGFAFVKYRVWLGHRLEKENA
jgi:hypothetical protein